VAILRKLDDAESRDYWKFVEKVGRDAAKMPDYLKGGPSKRFAHTAKRPDRSIKLNRRQVRRVIAALYRAADWTEQSAIGHLGKDRKKEERTQRSYLALAAELLNRLKEAR
jgi:hypothetical protein